VCPILPVDTSVSASANASSNSSTSERLLCTKPWLTSSKLQTQSMLDSGNSMVDFAGLVL